MAVTIATCVQVRALVTECEPEFRGNVKFKQCFKVGPKKS